MKMEAGGRSETGVPVYQTMYHITSHTNVRARTHTHTHTILIFTNSE